MEQETAKPAEETLPHSKIDAIVDDETDKEKNHTEIERAVHQETM
jgi:hypothetical protein